MEDNSIENSKEVVNPSYKRKSMKDLHNFVYTEIVGGEVDWYDESKGYGILNLFDEIQTEEGDTLSTLFIHINNYKNTATKPSSIKSGNILFCDSIVHDKKIVGFSWHTTEWTIRTLNYAFETIVKRPDKQYYLEKALSNIDNDVNQGLLLKILTLSAEGKSEIELKTIILFLANIGHKTTNISIQTDIKDAISKSFTFFSINSQLELWKEGIFNVSKFNADDYFTIIEEGIDICEFYRQLGNDNKILFLNAFIDRFSSEFNFYYKDYKRFMDFCIHEEDLDENNIRRIHKINEQLLVPHLFAEYQKDRMQENVVNAARDTFDKIPKLYKNQVKEKLAELISNNILETANDSEIISAIIEGFVVNGDISMIRNIDSLDANDYKKMFNNVELFGDGASKVIVDSLFNTEKYEMAFDYANRISPEYCEQLEQNASEKLSGQEFFELWKKGFVSRLPRKMFISYLLYDENEDYTDVNKTDYSTYESYIQYYQRNIGGRYKEWDSLFQDVKTENKLIVQVFKETMELVSKTNKRLFFQTYLNLLGYCMRIDNKIIEDLNENNFLKCAKWFLDIDDRNTGLVLDNIALFMPEQQIRIIKKLFYKFKNNEIKNPLEFINNALSRESDVNDSKYPLYDLTSRIIIDALKSYKETGEFIADYRLFKILSTQDARKDYKYSISNRYFAVCDGRTRGKFHVDFLDDANGKVEKIESSNGYYYTIKTDNCGNEFGRILDEIKQIAGRKWDSASKKWIIPSSSEDELLHFAKKNYFSINLNDNKLNISNFHFYRFEKVRVPIINKFCDGRPTGNPFIKSLWCDNSPCFSNNYIIHENNWAEYTMYDFCNILNINTDRNNIKNYKYILFVAHLNRFNKLLEKLYCKECGHILYPQKLSTFAKYSVTRFSCRNSECKEFDNEIYLNDCFNASCKSIIDSRESRQCPNGWYVCPQCGMCCTTEKIRERVLNLKYNNIDMVESIGHYDRNIYFCHKCRNRMEIRNDKLYCPDCNIEREIPQYRKY